MHALQQNPLAVFNTRIRQDEQGRFNLNDLHLAAGGKAKHRPNQFLRLDSTFELILEIDRCADMRIDKNQAVSVQKGGSGPQGTYACRELVIAYAAWINPAFHLKVLRAFLDAYAPQPRRIAYQNEPWFLRLCAWAAVVGVSTLAYNLGVSRYTLSKVLHGRDGYGHGHWPHALAQLAQQGLPDQPPPFYPARPRPFAALTHRQCEQLSLI